MSEWSESEVGEWLQSIGAPYAQYRKAFAENCVNGAALPELSHEELKELGVASGVHRARLIGDIKRLSLVRSVSAAAASVVPSTPIGQSPNPSVCPLISRLLQVTAL